MKVILYFQAPTKTDSAAEKLVGVREIGAKVGWHVQVIDSEISNRNIQKIINFWNPSGIIVECGERKEDIRAFRTSGKIPVIFIDLDPKSLPRNNFCVLHDSFSVGEAAARELMTTGFMNFAFVPFPGNWRWSDERRDGFLSALKLNGRSCAVFKTAATDLTSPNYTKDLHDFLRQLPKPCAIFVANDHPAEKVIAEATFLGISIPNELAILGVDNYRPICEHTTPQLSSVEPDFHRCGNLAALLLIAAMRDGKNFRGSHIRKYGTNLIYRRKSTAINFKSNDNEVDAARKMIRDHACDGLRAEEVMRTFSCSRPLASARFKAVTGHTILEEIHAVQLERIKELLIHPGQMIKSIADFCGFKSQNVLRKFFRRETGMTMSAWRKQHQ